MSRASPLKITQAIAEAMNALYEDGFTYDLIADRYNCAGSTVGRAIRKVRFGIPIAPAPIHTEHTSSAGDESHQAHIAHVLTVEPHGFSWWKPEVMERVYRLETAPPKRNSFWRAA